MDINYVLEWFKFANRDLAVAEHLQKTMHPQPLEVICYQCQQAAEKYLKGYLIYKGVSEPPKIHDLIKLLNMCLKFDEAFKSIYMQCEFLNRFSVLPRYPEELEIYEGLMERAVKYANEIKSFSPLLEVSESL